MTPRIDPARSIITVGPGRGFVVMTRQLRPLIVTAAHCLPSLPPCNPAYDQERTYRNLIGPLDETPSVSAECLFADPISDVAVLDEPESETRHPNYVALIEATPALRMSDSKRTPRGCYHSIINGCNAMSSTTTAQHGSSAMSHSPESSGACQDRQS